MAIPPRVHSSVCVFDDKPNAMYIKSNAEGFDITPSGRHVRLAIRIKEVAKEPIKAVTHSYEIVTLPSGDRGKCGTFVNADPDRVQFYAINEKTNECFENLAKVTFFVSNENKNVAFIMSVEKIE